VIGVEEVRREFLKLAGLGIVGGSVSLLNTPTVTAQRVHSPRQGHRRDRCSSTCARLGQLGMAGGGKGIRRSYDVGDLPATGLFMRHARNLKVSNLEVMT
jgi:hypothetical protein